MISAEDQCKSGRITQIKLVNSDLYESKLVSLRIVTPCFPKIHGNGVATRVSDVYMQGEYPPIHAKPKVT